MAVMSAADRARVARIFARQVYGGSTVCIVNHTDLVTNVGLMDDMLENTAANLPGTAGQSIAVRLNAVWQAPVSGISVAERSTLFSILISVKYGFIVGGGE